MTRKLIPKQTTVNVSVAATPHVDVEPDRNNEQYIDTITAHVANLERNIKRLKKELKQQKAANKVAVHPDYIIDAWNALNGNFVTRHKGLKQTPLKTLYKTVDAYFKEVKK